MDPITCHILDTTTGKPAAGVAVQLFYVSADLTAEVNNNDTLICMSKTDNDGRVKKWVINPDLESTQYELLGINNKTSWDTLKAGIYKCKFLTGKYFLQKKLSTFFPFVEIVFRIDNPPDNHYHIPLLLANHSYTTYRGS